MKQEAFERHKFRAIRAEWEKKMRSLPPEERYVTHELLTEGYALYRREKDPETRAAWLDWLSENELSH